MSLAPTNRRAKRIDLTRWNRAGLRRFEYVDGDAAVWLEELRIALMGLTARGADLENRLPERWQDLTMNEVWPDANERAEFADKVVWKALRTQFPQTRESARKRNERLLAQYGADCRDGGFEILRAFARASHVLLGHLDAYANEGYLRTATQWDSVRRLAQMVNYQPAPPASATLPVGLELAPDAGPVRVERRLAMSHAPASGGPPLIFETLAPIEAHPALNAVMVAGARFDSSPLGKPETWLAGDSVALAPGALAVLASDDGTNRTGVALKSVIGPSDGRATITLDEEPESALQRGAAILAVDPVDVRRGAPQTSGKQLVLNMPSAAYFGVGSLVRVLVGESEAFGVVADNVGIHLTLDVDVESAVGEVGIEAMTPYGGTGNKIYTSEKVDRLYFQNATGGSMFSAAGADNAVPPVDEDGDDIAGLILQYEYSRPTGAVGLAYAKASGAMLQMGAVIGKPPMVVPGLPAEQRATRIVRFEGKPPKGCEAGAWFVARSSGSKYRPLRLEGVRVVDDAYYLQFDRLAVPDDSEDDYKDWRPEKTEYHGPMRPVLRPVDHDRSPSRVAGDNELLLDGLDAPSQALVRVGRRAIVHTADPDGPTDYALAIVSSSIVEGDVLKVTLRSDKEFRSWPAGWTTVNLNVVEASHGETKPRKVLGSGDGERAEQRFNLSAKSASFIPWSASEFGVAPDMDVRVNEVRWEYRDAIDPSADGEEAFSTVLAEDGSLDILFRRRLPTGQNNVVVSRYRVGVGVAGNDVPALSFTKPMRKHPFVEGLIQPFAASGGADREAVARLREVAPARIAANGRAVSLQDFRRLVERHASISQARSEEFAVPGLGRGVRIVVVPVGGGDLGESLGIDLTAFVKSRALPGTAVDVVAYEEVALEIAADIYVDTSRFDRNTTRDAAVAALRSAFQLEDRRLGQTAYIAEAMAALEAVAGVESAVIMNFRTRSGAPETLDEVLRGSRIQAIYPFDNQVLAVVSPDDASVAVREVS